MSRDDLDEYWNFGSNNARAVSELYPSVNVEQIHDVEPLDNQFGVDLPKTVPDALYEPLFGQPNPSEAERVASGDASTKVPLLQTYAILDAAKVRNLAEMLENSDLEHRCFFKGAAYDEMRDVAPWVVRLEEGSNFTRNLFTSSDAPWHMWDSEPGIYIRSYGTLEQMWGHFRKFTKVQDEDGKWHYFRFWEPMFGALSDTDEFKQDIAPFTAIFAPQEPAITSIIMCRSSSYRVLNIDNSSSPRTLPWKLDEAGKQSIQRFKTQSDIHEIIQSVGRQFPGKRSAHSTALRDVSKVLLNIGFRKRDHFVMLLTYEALLGPGFLKEYEDGRIEAIIQSSSNADEAMSTIKVFLQKAQP